MNKGLVVAKVKVPSSLATMLLWIGGLKALEVTHSKFVGAGASVWAARFSAALVL